MATVTASSSAFSLTSRREDDWGNWSEASETVTLVFSAAIPANANVTEAVLTVNVTQDPIVGSYCTVDGQQVRTSVGQKQISITVSPGTSSRAVTVSFKGSGTTYSTAQMAMSLSLSVTYVIATTACGAPTSVTLDAAIAEGSTTLRWSGATGGTGNAITGYGIQYRDSTNNSTWGSWTDYTTVAATSGSASASVAPPSARGSYRQYRVQTRGSAGSSWYSGYTASGSLRKNQAPPAPALTYPAADATGSLTPAISIAVGSDPDGQTVTLYYQLDGGSWTAYTGVTRLSLTAGSHTLAIKAVDSLGAETAGTGRTFAVDPPSWARTISTGSVIANQTISHRADIQELLAAANVQRAWYGLSPMTLDSVGVWGKWRQNMADMRQSIEVCRSRAGLAAPSWTPMTGYPTAAVINEIREGVQAA